MIFELEIQVLFGKGILKNICCTCYGLLMLMLWLLEARMFRVLC